MFRTAVSIAASVLTLSAVASELIEFDFTGTNPSGNTPWTNTSVLHPHVEMTSGLVRGPHYGGTDTGLASHATNNAFGVQGWYPGNARNSLEDTVTNLRYIAFSIQAESPNVLNLRTAKVTYAYNKLSHWSPLKAALFTSVEGFDYTQSLGEVSDTVHGDLVPVEGTVTLPDDAQYDGVSNAVEFRIYCYEGRYTFHQASLDALKIHGGVVIPEPASAVAAVLLLALARSSSAR